MDVTFSAGDPRKQGTVVQFNWKQLFHPNGADRRQKTLEYDPPSRIDITMNRIDFGRSGSDQVERRPSSPTHRQSSGSTTITLYDAQTEEETYVLNLEDLQAPTGVNFLIVVEALLPAPREERTFHCHRLVYSPHPRQSRCCQFTDNLKYWRVWKFVRWLIEATRRTVTMTFFSFFSVLRVKIPRVL